MTTPELQKPTHLATDEKLSTSMWLRARMVSILTAVLGLTSFTVVYLTQSDTWATPDPRISVPGFVVTLIAGIAAVVRREKSGLWFAVAGVGLAGAAIVLGWFLMIAIILAAMLIAMLILKAVL